MISRTPPHDLRRSAAGAALALLLVPAVPAPAAEAPGPHAHAGGVGTPVTSAEGEPLGVVQFPTSCAPEAQVELERGLALVHHMNYERAEPAFLAASHLDPECALAYWGIAMSWVHPLWPDTVSAEQRAEGEMLLARARQAAHTSDRERAWIDALAAYYRGAERSERERVASFRDGWSAVHAAHPDDPEAALFHALGLLATAPAEDKSYANQLEAGRMLEGLLEQMPHHPGAHHYTIHAYDFPPLAGRALDIARRYDALAPENTHALHMTSHIFTRLGLWPESIEFNVRAARAAERRTPAGEVLHHHLHALDYLAYAYLQRADDVAAEAVLAAMIALQPPYYESPVSAYALAAVPARLALERRDWQRAATLRPRTPAELAWDRYPHLEAITWFALALGAAHTGALDDARAAVAELARLEERARGLGQAYDWGLQVAIQRLAAEAWIENAAGNTEGALELARKAAEMESTTEKNPVTPGEVLPANELYGDLLAAAGRQREAVAAYEVALERSPNRFNSLSGAAGAAERAGELALAESFYRQLAEVCPQPTGRHAEIQQAQRFLEARRKAT